MTGSIYKGKVNGKERDNVHDERRMQVELIISSLGRQAVVELVEVLSEV